MPIHEYKCSDCGKINELLIGIGRNSDELVCRECGGVRLESLISAAAHSIKFQLPGSAPGDSWWNKTGPQQTCAGGKDCKDKA